MSLINEPEKIIFYDGDCILCNRSVRFIYKRDRKKRIKFASLQSEFAEQFFQNKKIYLSIFDTIIYYDDSRVYIKSEAVIKIAESLGFPWSGAAVLYLIPRRMRDLAYDYVARKRHKWFKRKKSCKYHHMDLAGRILG